VHCLCDSSDPSVKSHAVRVPGFVDKCLVASRKESGATMRRVDRNIAWCSIERDNRIGVKKSVVKAIGRTPEAANFFNSLMLSTNKEFNG
jgi:hypothetical protein